eukprot:5932320-Heterocapsa_arctica.AAC.1
MNRLQQQAYVGKTIVWMPMTHGVPHRRRRMWFAFARVDDGPISDEEASSWAPVLDKMEDIILHDLAFEPVLLSKVLMKEGSEDLKELSGYMIQP